MTERRHRVGPTAIFLAGCLAASACTSDGFEADGSTETASGAASVPSSELPASTVPTTLPSVSLTVDASFGLLVIRGAEPGTTVVAVDPATDAPLATDLVEADGSALLAELPATRVRLIVERDGSAIADAGTAEVPDADPPGQRHYDDQLLDRGFSYLETRDGTRLSTFVTFPPGLSADDGPFPTLVEYSGYEPSNPDALDPARLTLPLLGYALVQVNVRGTGCSGGAFDPFSGLERLDGYDVVETVAAQTWSDGVGMWGVSYPGIMQLQVASTNPPNLAAIAPLSVISSIEDTLFPGGIYNDGFGRNWTERVTDGAASGGQRWVRDRIDSGDEICRANQALRIHNRNLVQTAEEEPFATPLSRTRSPETLADRIDVPVFLAGAWQDEQTGGGFPSMIDELQVASPAFRAYLYNGLHIDPLGPEILSPLLQFYDLYVARRSPAVGGGGVELLLAAGTAAFFGTTLTLPRPELAGLEYEQAKQRWLEQSPIRVLYEVGATAPNLPVSHFEAGFAQWPPPDLDAERRFLTAGGGIDVDPRPADESVLGRFTTNPEEGSRTVAPDLAEIWSATPGWDWPAADPRNRLSFATGALDELLVLTGPASADLRLRLPGGEPDADVEVTLIDIGPDGSETFIQAGVLRLSRRALGGDATALRPRITNTAADIDPVEAGEVADARVAILPFAHVLRPGHRLGLTIDTPGASRPEWTFDVIPRPVTIEVLSGSSVVLPVVTASETGDIADLVPATAPLCGSLRAQPCRPADETAGQ